MKFGVPTVVSTKAARTVLLGKKHSPEILFVAGIVGFGATVVTAARATLKVEEVLVEHQKMAQDIKTVQHETYSEGDRRHDLTLLYVKTSLKLTKLYGPSVVLGVGSIAALTGAHNIQRNRIAGITAAYTALDKAFDTYRQRVADEFGEEKEREIRYGVSEEKVEVTDADGKTTKKKVKTTNTGASPYARLFGEGNVNWSPTPEYNIMFVRSIQNWANDKLQAQGHLLLSEVYDEFRFERTQASTEVGWLREGGKGDGYVDFGVFDDRSLSRFYDYVTGKEGELLIDFNVDGVINHLIGRKI